VNFCLEIAQAYFKYDLREKRIGDIITACSFTRWTDMECFLSSLVLAALAHESPDIPYAHPRQVSMPSETPSFRIEPIGLSRLRIRLVTLKNLKGTLGIANP